MVPGAGSGRESFPTQGHGHRQLPPRDTLRLQSVLERGSGGVPRIYPALPTGAPLSSWSRLHCRGPRLRSAAPTPTEQLPPDRALLGRPPHPCRPPRDRSASSGAHGPRPSLTSVGVAQCGRLRGLGLLPLDGHHHLLLHALPARRACLHLLVGRQGQRGVVLVLEAFVSQRGLERRVVHGGGGAAGGGGEARAVRGGGGQRRGLLALSGRLWP